MIDLKQAWAALQSWATYYRVVQNLVALASAGGAVWVFVESLADDFPFPVVLTLSFLTLASVAIALNQIRLLMGGAVIVEHKIDLRHGLSYERVNLVFDQNPNSGALQFGLILANNSNVPIQFELERLDVIIGNFTTPQAAKIFVNKGTVIHVGQSRVFRDAPIPIALIQPLVGARHSGSLEAHFKYGRAGDLPARRYRIRLHLTVSLTNQPGLADVVQDEVDEEL